MLSDVTTRRCSRMSRSPPLYLPVRTLSSRYGHVMAALWPRYRHVIVTYRASACGWRRFRMKITCTCAPDAVFRRVRTLIRRISAKLGSFDGHTLPFDSQTP
eukprot:540091-Rhodomonas_salina.1